MENEISNSTKWSFITEIVARLVSPISNMVLARLLTPEAFGVVATATMVFSFADMFTDSGFQKYLIQHDFKSDNEQERSTTVAFWTNMLLSLVFWALISMFSDPLATIVGSPGMGLVLIVACASLPLTAFSSIQMSLYKRNFDFKTLFYVRMVGTLIPLTVTVPLAFLTHSYWALIIGTLCGNLTNAIILSVKSDWKPRLFYNINVLWEMLSFSFWSLVEAVAIWMTSYLDIFLIGAFLSTYYLGLYKTAMTTTNQLTALIATSMVNVLFPALSRAQNNMEEFRRIFLSFQKKAAFFLLPMGVGVFVYRDFVVSILLGSQWVEAINFLGLWSLVSVVKIIFSNFCSEAYRSLGRPKVSVLVQISQLIVMIPAILYGASHGFDTLCIMRCLVSCELIIVNLIVIKFVADISVLNIVKNILPEIVSSLLMGLIAYMLRILKSGMLWTIFSILICIILYFIFLLCNQSARQTYLPYMKMVFKNYRSVNNKSIINNDRVKKVKK